ncbi:2OG-Fe(II) oxygenase family protein [Sedimenticola hydrogenitrophicus]|uniref:2OG-Fe(II) oxygenase family protein n=1 Tax=Sedimenticola hydrogenitrophicus TaxID=2967975 RepID=UPI0023B0F054|nr:2OG-Fe(II) oxygenase family protein [Sedimenticola hydrogenitrophicus]
MNGQPVWMEKVEQLGLFPTPVWTFHLTAAARARVQGEMVPLLDRLRPVAEARPAGQGWQSPRDLHRHPECATLVGYIDESIGNILRYLKIGYEAFEITGCWANVNPPGVAHRSHSHPNNYLSGVYYLQTPAGADSINFHDPRVQAAIIRPPVTELTAANTDQVVVRVEPGTLLLFPAWLQHSVEANGSDAERISISFNMMFSAYAEQLGKPLW